MKRGSIIEDLAIEDIGAKGKGVGKHSGKVVFAKLTAPGDVVDVRIYKSRKNYSDGDIVRFKKKSDSRAEPFCEHFGTCGGCKLQHIAYANQLKYKEETVVNALKRIGKVKVGEFRPIIGSPKEKNYRNKLEYTFSNNRWFTKEEIDSGATFENREALGFHIPENFAKIVHVNECHLQEDLSNHIRNTCFDYAIKNDLSFYDIREHTGLLRNLIVRSTSINEWMVILSFGKNEPENIEKLMQFLIDAFPQVTSWNYIINTKLNDSYFDLDVTHFAGKTSIEENFDGIRFTIGPKSFFQTNSTQGLALYKLIVELAAFDKSDVVYDLYTGIGSIAQFVSKHVKEVIGIESIKEAIDDAKKNMELNEIENCRFYTGDVLQILTDDFVRTKGKPNVIITDPPRAGMHQKVVERLLDIEPDKIIYVSCNPATQARDLSILDVAYEVKVSQPVDMFPHTPHIENIVVLHKK